MHVKAALSSTSLISAAHYIKQRASKVDVTGDTRAAGGGGGEGVGVGFILSTELTGPRT